MRSMVHRLALGVLGAVVSTACGTLLGTSEDPPAVGNGDGGAGADGAGADGRSEGATSTDASGDGATSDADAKEAGDAGNTSKLVFVTSGLTQGDLRFGATATPAGPSGANAHCNEEAMNAGLGGTFVAWISTGNVSAVSNLNDGFQWVGTDGALVFPSKAWIMNGGLPIVPIARDAKGAIVDANADGGSGIVWTGTTNKGQPAGSNCVNWSSTGAAAPARYGILASRPYWSDTGVDDTCEKFNHVLCFEK